MVLAAITRYFPDSVVIGGGLLLLLVAVNLRFDHLVALTILSLSITEIRIEGFPEVSFYLRLASRLGRWFLFLAMGLKGVAALLRSRPEPHPIRAVAVCIVLLAMVSAVWSIDWHISVMASLVLALVFLCAFGIIWRLIDSAEAVERLMHAVYRPVWPLVTISIILFFAVGPAFSWSPGERWGGLYRNANGLGLASAMLFPLAVWEVSRKQSSGMRAVRIFALVCAVIGVILSGSRSALMGMTVSASVLLLYRYRRSFPVIGAIALAFICAYVLTGGEVDPMGQDEVAVLLRADTLHDLGGRIEKWEIAWDYIQSSTKTLLVGHGYGTSRIVTLGETEGSILQKAVGLRGLDFHSSHIQMWLELGLAGVILLEILMIQVLLVGLSLFRRAKAGGGLSLLGAVLFAALLVMVGDTFAHGWLFSPGSGLSFIFWMYAAIVVRVAMLARAEQRSPTAPETDAPGMRFVGGHP
jgi:hypothetical protein